MDFSAKTNENQGVDYIILDPPKKQNKQPLPKKKNHTPKQIRVLHHLNGFRNLLELAKLL